MQWAWRRIVVIGCLFGLAYLLPRDLHLYSYFSLLLAHFALGFVYARRPILASAQSWHRGAGLLVCLAAGLALWHYLGPKALALYFGLHHAFTEASLTNEQQAESTFTWRAIFHLLIYLIIIDGDPEFPNYLLGWKYGAAWVGVAGSGMALVWILRDQVKLRQDVLPAEAIAIVVAISAIWIPYRWHDVIFYHIALWLWLPLAQLRAQGPWQLPVYLLANVVLTACFLAISPISPLGWRVAEPIWMAQVILWSYLHVSLSFSLSPRNPIWLRQALGTAPRL